MGGVNQQNVNFIWFAKPRSGQVLAVRRDDLFVPVKAVFPAPLEGAAALVVLVHIDDRPAAYGKWPPYPYIGSPSGNWPGCCLWESVPA